MARAARRAGPDGGGDAIHRSRGRGVSGRLAVLRHGLDKLASHLDRSDLALRTARAAFNPTWGYGMDT